MALIVQTDEGLLTANSYASLEFAQEHLILSGDAEGWEDMDQDLQEGFLQLASRFFDDNFDPDGEPVLDYPGLRYPRRNAKDRDKRLIVGIPRGLKEGVVELAHFFSQNNPFGDSELAGIESIQVDVLSVKFGDLSSDLRSKYPASTMSKLGQFGQSSTGGGRRVAYVRVV